MLFIYTTIIYTINITSNTYGTDNINNMLLLIYTTTSISKELYDIAIVVIHIILLIILIQVLTIC